MRLSDYLAKRLQEFLIEDIFMVTGGAAMHLNDAFARNGNFRIHHLHHEQSCAMAAESYGRLKQKPAILNVTAGPGGINAINGVFGSYVDSIPMIIISGQAKRETLVGSSGDENLRQLGDQEVDIISMVKKVTKYSKLVLNPEDIRYELEKCYFLCLEGRPGPCWLDIPIDVQAANIEPLSLKSYTPRKNIIEDNNEKLKVLFEKIKNAKKPLILAGSGIRSSNTQDELINFGERFGIPIATAWNSNDLIWDEHFLYAGRPGSVGNRTGNFAVQFCDLLIVLGSRLNIRIISYNWECFADKAWKCHVDIDKSELDKKTLNMDLKMNMDLRSFFKQSKNYEIDLPESRFKWINWLKENLKKYPVPKISLKEDIIQNNINPYIFFKEFSSKLKEKDVVVFGDGTACVAGFQASIIKKGQRFFHNSGCASMGYALPAAIGANIALNKKIYCVTGDGSIMMNIQELAVISSLSNPVILFILDNSGYHSIRQTQKNFFPDVSVGCGTEDGLFFPNFEKLAKGFGLNSLTINTHEEMIEKLPLITKSDTTIVVILKLDLNINFEPKLSSKKLENGTMMTSRLEDMSPFLSQKELGDLKNEANKI